MAEYRADQAVPIEERHYGFRDMLFTWIGANANPGTWFVGGVVAALGFAGAAANIFICNPIAYAIMALVAFIGFKVGTTTMGLLRVPFGIQASKVPALLNIGQFVGWCAVNTFIASISMSFLFKILFGWPSYGEPGSMGNMAFCITLTSVLQIVLTVVGGSRSIKWFETIACTLLIFLTVWETAAILKTYDLSQIVTWRPPENLGAGLTFGTAMDAMAAFSLGWVPLVADFTRYTKNKSAAVIAPMIGANVALFWFALVGVLGVIATTLASGAFDPNKSDPSSVAAALGLGWVAFGVLILSTVTTNVVDIYSAGMSVSTVLPKVKPFTGLWIAAILALLVSYIPLFVGSFLNAFILFLDYIGFIFAPILGILIVDYYLIRKRQYDWNYSTTVNGPYWYSNGINWRGVGAWVLGIVIFLIVKNTEFLMNTTGAIYPTLFLSAIIYWFIAKGSVVAVPKAAEKTTGA